VKGCKLEGKRCDHLDIPLLALCSRCDQAYSDHNINSPHRGTMNRCIGFSTKSHSTCAPLKQIEHVEDGVNHPAHYTSSPAVCSKCGHPIECIDVVRHMGFQVGNAVKYLWRAGKKGDELEDLKKSRWYIEDRIAQLEKERAK
jgi:hypothetical protein